MTRFALLACAAAFVVAGCSTTGGGDTASASSRDWTAPVGKDGNAPFPSTYKPYPGRPTALVGATIYDGRGGRIDNGTVLFRDGKVAAVGDASLSTTGYDVVDGSGKFVTPGVIDIHSHLGDYPTPSVEAHSDGNEATAPMTPEVWAEHSVWPQDPGFTRALANGGVTSPARASRVLEAEAARVRRAPRRSGHRGRTGPLRRPQ